MVARSYDCNLNSPSLPWNSLELRSNSYPNLPVPQEENGEVCRDLAADLVDYVWREPGQSRTGRDV